MCIRDRYFLIVPYVLREAVDGRYGKDVNRVLRAIDSAEKDCGIRLLNADPKAEGVIGTRVLPKGWVARKDVYKRQDNKSGTLFFVQMEYCRPFRYG